jgi:HlyD family secretion protein
MKNKYFFLLMSLFYLGACTENTQNYDATGVFEADEVIISAEATGKLIEFGLTEGQTIKKGQTVAVIDCEQIKLQKKQMQSTVNAVGQKQNDPNPQINILKEQLIPLERQVETQEEQVKVLEKERVRIDKLVKADAVPAKQLDDIVGQLNVLQKQIVATKSQKNVILQQIRSQEQIVAIQNRSIMSEQKPIEDRLPLYDDQLRHCSITAPFTGTVLLTYAKASEIAAIGKPLFKLANMDTLTLRAYISGDQLGQVKINQSVKILTDNGKDKYKESVGLITWIANKAEFTPKTIQTKDERANLVYAIKIKVPNDGFLKIGMYGEVDF